MDENIWVFNVFYILLCFFIIYPSEEVQRLGLTIESMFATWLGEEHLNFIRYQQRRTSLHLLLHSCLPAYYFLVYNLKYNKIKDPEINDKSVLIMALMWNIAEKCSLIFLLIIIVKIHFWYQGNWQKHPITKTLLTFSDDVNTLPNIITQINSEYLNPLTFEKRLNSISRLIVSDNWIIKTSLYKTHIAYQGDCILKVEKTSTYNVSQDRSGRLQMVTILVDPNRANVPSFYINIDALEFAYLEEKIRQPIIIPPNVQFHRSIIDHFVEVFKQQVNMNGTYKAPEQIMEKCFACMVNEPNIKIHKQCRDIGIGNTQNTTNNACTNCNCVPMWCVDCLGRWFAIRQKDHRCDEWLQQKCTCPMCRATFCILDVCYVENPSHLSRATQTLPTNDYDE